MTSHRRFYFFAKSEDLRQRIYLLIIGCASLCACLTVEVGQCTRDAVKTLKRHHYELTSSSEPDLVLFRRVGVRRSPQITGGPVKPQGCGTNFVLGLKLTMLSEITRSDCAAGVFLRARTEGVWQRAFRVPERG